ncbi:amino acid adenylation domain-containing protein [Bacillus pakistanensis]|uniref:Amino acid adenylation domain-containing protein n=1 Tax=Rossellomorea pakistanensis TaxID=992288 RepID=A0ABS2NE39_9BACI|nr:amino acid adenylation domain-containing protein [Bacillus pakistanensis]
MTLINQTIKTLNKDYAGSKGDQPLITIFKEQVIQNPNAIACESSKEKITYKELDEQSTDIACNLIRLGVKPGTIVGTLMSRSIDLFVSWLGVLKAGAAYLPIDPTNPKERIQYILQDSNVNLLITGSDASIDIKSSNLKDVTVHDLRTEQDFQELVELPASTLDSLSYLIYTSGSTGKPKGVPIKQKGIIRLVKNTNYVNILPSENVAQVSNASFDAITFEVWGALLNGAKLVIAEQALILSPNKLSDWLIENEIKTMFITTALFNKVAEELPTAFSNLSNLLFGGEACNKKWVQQVLEKGAPEKLLHVYGPTECTTFALSYCVNSSKEFTHSDTIPIGKPITKTEAFVLGADLKPVEIGQPGELYIGGDGLAIGYWNRPDLTKDRFIEHPFSTEIGSKLYKTGDIVKALPDGNIEFIGRSDFQVKLRGFRIELGEIEETLRQNKVIKESVVLLKETKNSDKKLICYYTTEDRISKREIRTDLSEKLPHYMIPSVFIEMEKFPLTSNGKIDRAKLPAPKKEDLELEEYVSPRNELEEILASIWEDVLDIEKIGIHDHFFELGGHSLLATQVISRIHRKLKKKITIQVLFGSPTIAKLAKHLMGCEQINEGSLIAKNLNSDGRSPLSLAQKRLWFLNQLEPENVAYNIPFAYQIKGSLSYEHLEKSLNRVMERHECLRTTFMEEKDGAIQVVQSEFYAAIEVINISELSSKEREIPNIIRKESWVPFDLKKGPLLRAKVIKTSATSHILLLVVHHIAFDGWSETLFLEELNEIYFSLENGQSPKLPELMIQYSDYANWQQTFLDGESIEKQKAYWKEKLKGELPVLEIPTDYPRPLEQTTNGNSIPFELPEKLSIQLKALSQKESTTLYMTLMAAFKVLLYRYTGQKDLLIGTPVGGRNREEIERLIGFFVNTIVIRTELHQNLTFKEYLNQVKQTCLSAYANQDVPFEKLVEEIQPERNLSHNPIFQAMFIYHNKNQSNRNSFYIGKEEVVVSKEHTKFDITLFIEDQGNKIVGEFQYKTDLYKQSKIEQFLNHFLCLLDTISIESETPIDHIPILSKKEKQDFIEMASNSKDFPIQKSIYTLFEDQAKHTPEAVALQFKNQSISYQDLEQKAKKLAHFLLEKQGIQKNSIVGVYCGKSIDVVISILAVLKSGACLLPIDVNYPRSRQEYMVNHSMPEVILTTQQHVLDAKSIFSGETIKVDEEHYLETKTDRHHAVDPNDNAYIIYTSGSTGNPKAIINRHIGVTNYLTFMKKEFGINSKDVVLQLASLSVDGFLRDLIGPLTTGARIILVEDEKVKDHDHLLSLIETNKVTCLLSTVPSMLKVLAKSAMENELNYESVRMIFSSGEVLNHETAMTVLNRFNHTKLVNLYGPTECTLTTTFKYVDKQPSFTYDVGKPIDNMFVFVLDKHLQPVPAGVVGEIYISGVGMTKGYFNNPVQTEKSFISNPYSSDDLPLYKTGDVGLYLPNGNIELKGRIDRQTKIRGFRIEMDEVERIIVKHPAIHTAIVLVKENKQQDQYLEGYILPNQGQELSLVEVFTYLRNSCPDYMIPTYLNMIHSLPKTPNGKIDRKRLHEVTVESKLDHPVEPVKNDIEEKILGIWNELLDKENISVNDNFFEVGGHSLLATQIISKIRKKLELEVPLLYLFKYPTIRELSSQLENMTSTNRKITKMKRIPRRKNI